MVDNFGWICVCLGGFQWGCFFYLFSELECGQLSSSTESDDSSEEANPNEEEHSLEDGEGENDVEDETMFGKEIGLIIIRAVIRRNLDIQPIQTYSN